MEYYVCFRINNRVQPILFITESDHRFIDSNVIRILSDVGL